MSILRPDREFDSVDKIPLELLRSWGVRCVLLDRDNTCFPRDTWEPPQKICAWARSARDAGMALCMISNNFHGRDVEASAARLGMDCVHHAMKPAPFSVWVALARMGVPAEQAVLVGDQVFTDLAAGNLAGVRTILVRPLSRSDMWYTHLFRVGERLVLHEDPFRPKD